MIRSTLPATSFPAWPALDRVRRECERRVHDLGVEGLPAPALEGQLIRPLVAYAAAGAEVSDPFWSAALAVQYAHEASLLHDDVIDQATLRRGRPTVASARGVAAALVEGDHLLTTAYRLAARTGSLAFAELFAAAVERTVAGERLQAAWRGRVLSAGEYRQVVAGKSGELLGAALAAGPLLAGDARAARFHEVGREVGVCYQMIDDLLDYCPSAETGKGVLADYRQRVWTWPLAQLPGVDWERDAASVVHALARSADGAPPLAAALDTLRASVAAAAAGVRALLPGDELVTGLLDDWLARAERAVAATMQEHATAPLTAWSATPTPIPADAATATHALPAAGATRPAASVPVLPDDHDLGAFFEKNSRSFSFAARWFPRRERARVADVYAFCRVTDDLADAGTLAAPERARALDEWVALCRRAYHGEATGVAVLDRVLLGAAQARVPFRYVEQLVAGMRMDLVPRRYESLAELRVYTHRVASVVGLWLTRLWGVHDECVLERAADLGHAMQLTNILRDVGEDWRAGRLYLPRDLLAHYQVDESLIASIAAGAPVPARWRALTEELMAVADAYYERGFAAIPCLPSHVRAPVAVAAMVYQGIHDEIRRNGCDNLTRRARTSAPRKLWLAIGGLRRLRRARLALARPPRPRVRGLRAAVAGLFLAFAVALSAHGQAPGSAGEPPLERLASVEAQLALTPVDSLLHLERVRLLYRLAVGEEPAVAQAEAALAALRTEWPGLAAQAGPLLTGYQGAIRLLRAKHGSWPIARLRHARAGLRLLDDAVRAAPDDIEIRYLRLVSGYHLPGLFGRGATVRADFAALAALLPERQGPHGDALLREVAAFLLAYGELDAAARVRIEQWQAAHG